MWLMTQSKQHETMPLHMYWLSEKGTPLFYMAWANFDATTEADYLMRYNLALTPLNWNCGDRPWVLFVVAPLGGRVQECSNWCKRNLFKDEPEVRFFVPRGQETW